MAEEAQDGGRRPKALLEDLADFKIGQTFGLNLRVFLEPIGILKFLLILFTLFAFALTAGYNSSKYGNQATCQDQNNDTHTLTLRFSYPYHPPGYSFIYSPDIVGNTSDACFQTTERRVFGGSAEFFVAMSSFSFIFAILSFPFYFIFYVPRYDLAKYLSIIDLIITCLLVFFYFIADIAWSAGISDLRSYHIQLLKDKRNLCLGQICLNEASAPSPDIQNTVQLSFSVMFGWLSSVILAATIWFTYKDTIIHQERMGPVYRLPFCQKKKSSAGADTYTPKKEEEEQQPGGGYKEEEGGAADLGPSPEDRGE